MLMSVAVNNHVKLNVNKKIKYVMYRWTQKEKSKTRSSMWRKEVELELEVLHQSQTIENIKNHE